MAEEKLKELRVDDRVRKKGRLGNKLGVGIIKKTEENDKGHLDYLVEFKEQNASGWFRKQHLEKIGT